MKKGFTLAETLITLGIIGVVATLTLPNLMADYKKKTYVAQLQRTYNMIINAFQNFMVDEDVQSLNDTYLYVSYSTADTEARIKQFLNKYMRVTKNCGSVFYSGNSNTTVLDGKSCYASSYKSVAPGSDGGAFIVGDQNTKYYCVAVNTGATICMSGITSSHAMKLSIDVNGKKGPNTMGRDAFSLRVNNKGDISEGFSPGFTGDECMADNGRTYGAEGCFTKILNDGWVMDY